MKKLVMIGCFNGINWLGIGVKLMEFYGVKCFRMVWFGGYDFVMVGLCDGIK